MSTEFTKTRVDSHPQGTSRCLSVASLRSRDAKGFTLIELMITVSILGILAAVAINAYTKNIRRARRTEITSDMSKLSLAQDTAFRVRGHYVSTTALGINSFGDFYPAPTAFVPSVGNRVERVQWQMDDPGYHRDGAADGAFFRGGGPEHGFDVLSFMPEGGFSRCSYATQSGEGSFTDPATGQTFIEAPHATFLGTVFNDDDRYKNRPWFVNMAACDLDADGKYWFFFTNSYDSRVYEGINLPGPNAVSGAY